MIARPAAARCSRSSRSASIVDVAGVGYDVQVPLSTFYGARRAGRRPSRCASTPTCARTRLRCSASRRALEQELFERLICDQRHRPEARAGGAVGHRARRAGARDPHAGRRAPDQHSRHRQEDRGAHRPRAEGSPAAALRAAGRRAAPTSARGPACAPICSRRSLNLGYQRPAAEKAVDTVLKDAAGIVASNRRCATSLPMDDDAVMSDEPAASRAARGRRRRAVRGRAAAADARRLHRPGPRSARTCRCRSPPRGSAARRSITCCSTVRPVSARRRSRTSSPTSSACRSARPPAR